MKKSDLNKKVILISGSTHGIGLGIAIEMASAGYQVIVNGRDQAKLNIALKLIPNSCGFLADVSNPEEAKNLIEFIKNKFGCLDYLVANVGSGQTPDRETYSGWLNSFHSNFLAATNLIELGIEIMPQGSESAIVCISSICGLQAIEGAPIPYSVTKAALNAYVRCVSRPLGKKGVRINAVAPGNIIFDGSVWEELLSRNKHEVTSMLEQNVTLNKLGKPEDIAKIVKYLLSSEANFITGAVFTVDGGQVRGL